MVLATGPVPPKNETILLLYVTVPQKVAIYMLLATGLQKNVMITVEAPKTCHVHVHIHDHVHFMVMCEHVDVNEHAHIQELCLCFL